MRTSAVLALAATLSQAAAAVPQGFNYGSTNSDGSPKTQDQFTSEFKAAASLVGGSGFTSARLYTMIQGGSSTNQPIEAIPAAISAGTSLLLGVWASGGQAGINAELIALKSAITQYGSAFTKLVIGLSVGSEDLYRISPTGVAAKSGYGAEPSDLVNYIGQVRSALAGTPLSGVQIGHVDTWTAWVNGSNSAVINAVDWVGVDAYPYFQNTQSNGIDSNAGLFNDAYSATAAVAGGKSVWITETGFPVSGPTENLAVPSVANAKQYWDQVGCANFGKVPTFWYTLFDAPSSPSFGIVGNTLSSTPLFDLSCSAVSSSSSAAPSSSAASQASSAASSSAVASSVASNPPASSGGGLSPTLGSGNGVPASIVSQVTASATGTAPLYPTTGVAAPTNTGSPSAGGNGNGTTVTSIVGPSTTRTGASATTSVPVPGSGNIFSISHIGAALAAVCVIMATL